MPYTALATDYDGTLARHGVVDPSTIAALDRLRESGRKLILVTGRELEDLLAIFPEIDRFDRAVVENGAVIYHPRTQAVRVLTEPPPDRLIAELTRRGVEPLSVGRTIVATTEPHEHVVLTAIHDLGLEWHVEFNKGSVMVLPSGVTKATGLLPVLKELELPPEQVVAVGDAENDHAFLAVCGCAVAVANALPALRERADVVTTHPNGAGVTELIDRILTDGLTGIGRG
jgi:HAD superfamily hydrolase (TIGR01484 family)